MLLDYNKFGNINVQNSTDLIYRTNTAPHIIPFFFITQFVKKNYIQNTSKSVSTEENFDIINCNGIFSSVNFISMKKQNIFFCALSLL